MHKTHWMLLFILLSGCATIGVMQWDELYGPSSPENRISSPLSPSDLAIFKHNVKPIIENRCVVCHGCFDAPCQLKMESPQAIERGANKTLIYDGARLRAIEPTYFQNEQQSTISWREKGFFPILNERQQTPEANVEASVFYQMLKLKHDNPLPATPILDDSFDFSLDRTQQCPTIEEFKQYQKQTPLAGMPYGLPNLPQGEYKHLVDWLKNGAQMPTAEPMLPVEKTLVKKWETFLNNDALKSQLMARYLYEHLYLANLYLQPHTQSYFTLVRSYTPPGEPIATIISRRPYDDPKTSRVYYRLSKNNNAITVKRHMPYRFDEAKLARINSLFIAPDYTVTHLPSYELAKASNPFKTFAEIPAKSRYQFMLDEAQFSIMNFIKGPVCRGQIALNVIEDHFWIFFEDPRNLDFYHIDDFVNKNSDLLQMPAATSNSVLSILDWRKYANRQQQYIAAKLQYLQDIKIRQSDVDIDLIWKGEGNTNAVLTIFRHFDSASVIKGAVGDPPKTSWVIGYPLLERIHYLLVAGFDVYGDVAHQLKTRLYMDFLRMEGESKFIHLLPKAKRKAVYEHWYRETNASIMEYVLSDSFASMPDTNIVYKTADPQTELYTKLLDYTQGSLNKSYQLNSDVNGYKLKRLNNLKGENVSILPQLSYVMVENGKSQSIYTLINNSGHLNVAHLFSEAKRRIKQEDSLDVVKGIVGAYPNAFFKVDAEQLGEFVFAFENIASEADYNVFRDKYGVRRTDPSFWEFSDKLHLWYQNNQPKDYGLLDYNRLENR